MAKRKVFVETDLRTSRVEHKRSESGAVIIPLEVIPRNTTDLHFRHAGRGARQFNFGRWYGIGIDPITYACERQIERFLDKQDSEVEPTTAFTYCQKGLAGFLQYLSMFSAALCRDLTLSDIHRGAIDGYLGYLRDAGTSVATQKSSFSSTKAVLKALCRRGLIQEVVGGDNATFPRNPFPGAHKATKGERPLTKDQRKAFSVAVKTAVMPIFSDDAEPTSELLAYALLVIALHTGRNTWPLLEMSVDCLRSHPKDNTVFLVLYKRRGHSTSKVAIRDSNEPDPRIQSMPTIRPSVARLIRRVIELSKQLSAEAPEHLRDRVWLYRMRTPARGVGGVGMVSALNECTLARSIGLLVKQHKLVDADGLPLRLNVSRLRKTFINRIYEILDGDVLSTAVAAGHSVSVTASNYLRPSESAMKSWRFMGTTLVEELLTHAVGSTERTPVGRCSDSTNGDFAPKRDGATCMEFLSCLKCRNYVVTADDLYRLYSFYWCLINERGRMDPKRWRRQFAHIVRLIERDVIEVGLSKRLFKQQDVDRERARAKCDPHPFWRSETIIADLAGGLI